ARGLCHGLCSLARLPPAPGDLMPVPAIDCPLPEYTPCPVLTPKEAAAALGCTRPTVYALIDRGELHGYRAGTRLRLYATSLPAYKECGPVRRRPAAPVLPPVYKRRHLD